MIITEVLKDKNYALLAGGTALAAFLAYPAVQVYASGGLQNFDVWFRAIPAVNLAAFMIFTITFGALLSLQVYNLRVRHCGIEETKLGASSGTFGAVLAFIVPACPACLSLASLILPAGGALGFAQVMAEYGALLLLVSTGLLVAGIYLLGGFKEA